MGVKLLSKTVDYLTDQSNHQLQKVDSYIQLHARVRVVNSLATSTVTGQKYTYSNSDIDSDSAAMSVTVPMTLYMMICYVLICNYLVRLSLN